MQFGGVIYSDSADKAARFIMNCNQKGVPLVFLQDVTGFMVGSRSEHGGIIKDGAKMVNAVANSTVPKFTVVVGNSYGAGNYAMCGKAYDPRLIVAWPTAKIAVMGGDQAAKVLQQIEVARLKKNGEKPDEATQDALYNAISERYEEQTSPVYAAARFGWMPSSIQKILATGSAQGSARPITLRWHPSTPGSFKRKSLSALQPLQCLQHGCIQRTSRIVFWGVFDRPSDR